MEDTRITAATVTADDVAAAAGVSRWTVARAFKKDAPISRSSRERVLAAADTLGYVPDLHASGLASDRSNLVAIITNDFDNPHKLVLLERLSRILRDAGWGTLLVHMAERDDASEALLAASQRRVDAAVVIGTTFDDRILDTALGARRLKKLVIFARYSQNPNTLAIACDDLVAMRQIADHLAARGYRRPLFVAGPDTQSAKLHRKSAFAERWQAQSGVAVPIIHADAYDFGPAIACVTAHLTATPRDQWPDVLVCENDIIAMGAVDALRFGLGLRVPEDIAVTGFDDIPISALPAYRLTTYRQPITAMARALLQVLDGTLSENVSLPGQLIVRDSA